MPNLAATEQDWDTYFASLIETNKEIGEFDDKMNFLIAGNPGSGKTSLLRTCKKPVLIHSFDPGGCRGFIGEEGMIIDTRFEAEDDSQPTAFDLFAQTFDRLRADNAFAKVGTYCIDSATTYVQALMNRILKDSGRAGSVPQLQDYMKALIKLKSQIKLCTTLPCDFILTGHLSLEKDEVSGRAETGLALFKSIRAFLPLLFDEYYVLDPRQTPSGINYELITQSTGYFQARTRTLPGILSLREPADLTALKNKIKLAKIKRRTEQLNV